MLILSRATACLGIHLTHVKNGEKLKDIRQYWHVSAKKDGYPGSKVEVDIDRRFAENN